MVAQNVTFWILAVAMVLAAIGVVRSQNVVHAALYLVVVLAGAAAQYILLAAEFVAWVQVLIYIGAVIILFLFGIMLTRAPMRGDTNLDNDQRWPAAVVSVFLAGVLATLLVDAFGDKEIKLSDSTHMIVVSRASLAYSATDLIDHNGIYTCNAPFTVDGIAHTVADNDIYAAVYRDLVTAFNLGFIKKGANTSSTWWGSPAFPFNSFDGTYYNAYAQVVANNYPGAYGFPFADRYKHVLADLGGKVDAMTITVLGDATVVPGYTPQGNINPQTGSAGPPATPQVNVILVTPDNNFNLTTFKFDLQQYQGGHAYTFPTTLLTGPVSAASAQVNGVPTQEGLNIYTLELRGYQYSVLVKVTNGVIIWASIAGGGNANLTGSNVYIGGLN